MSFVFLWQLEALVSSSEQKLAAAAAAAGAAAAAAAAASSKSCLSTVSSAAFLMPVDQTEQLLPRHQPLPCRESGLRPQVDAHSNP